MLDRFFRWLAGKLVHYYAYDLQREFQKLYTGPDVHPAPVPETDGEWERRELYLKTSPGVEYEICRIEKPTVFEAYLDCSNLMAVDSVLFILSLRLKEDDDYKPFLVQPFSGARLARREREKLPPPPKMVIFKIPSTRSPAGLKLTINQTAGVSRQLYCLYYARSPDV